MLENPVSPRRACQAWPLASLNHVYVGKFQVYRTDQTLICTLPCFLLLDTIHEIPGAELSVPPKPLLPKVGRATTTYGFDVMVRQLNSVHEWMR